MLIQSQFFPLDEHFTLTKQDNLNLNEDSYLFFQLKYNYNENGTNNLIWGWTLLKIFIKHKI